MKNLLILTLVIVLASTTSAGLKIKLYELNGTPYTGRPLLPSDSLEIRLEVVGGIGDIMFVLYCDETYGVIGKTSPPIEHCFDCCFIWDGIIVGGLGPTEDGFLGGIGCFDSNPPYPDGVYFWNIPFHCEDIGDVVLKLVDVSDMTLMDSVIIHQDAASPPPVPCPITYPTSDCDGSYTVSWEASGGATVYVLERSKGGAYANVYLIIGGNTSYSESGLGNGSYHYRVRACNASVCSDYCTGDHDCVVYIPPAAPATLTVPASDADGAYTVSWTGIGRSYILSTGEFRPCFRNHDISPLGASL